LNLSLLGVGAAALIAGTPLASPAYAGVPTTNPPLVPHYFKLLNTSSAFSGEDYVADVMWASTAPYQGVFLWPQNNSFSQQFEVLDSGNGYFRLQARHSGQCLMLDSRHGLGNGTPVIQYPYCDAGYDASEWRWGPVLEKTTCSESPCFREYFRTLVNRATGKCLDARNGWSAPPPQQSVLQQWDCITTGDDWNADNQGWELIDAQPPPPPIPN
jgi:hypothetical protein